jgi:phenylpropionate dioxygenase-like ring-hydroxylating dioxygenase large terminal subunit
MVKSVSERFPEDAVRDDFVPKQDFHSKEFAELEKERLWPYVWQLACREEEIPNVGDYVTYDILDDSIIVVRSQSDQIRAFHNVCPHRGTRLTEGCSHAKQFVCSFHGWRFGLDGRNINVVDRKDWGDLLSKDDLRLKEVQVGTWGGFVFINMDAGSQPLEEFLSPIIQLTNKHEFEKLRYAWYRTVVMPANWKITMEAFNEFYHVQTTHHQQLPFTNDASVSKTMGRHGWISYALEAGFPLSRSPRLPPKKEPARKLIRDYADFMKYEVNALQTERGYEAAQRIQAEATDETPLEEVLTKLFQYTYQAAIDGGSGWPQGLTPEYLAETGFDWHVFPNTIFLHPAIEAVLWYRFRPLGDQPDKCIFDIWSLERFAPGKEPPLKREFYNDWREFDWPKIFQQDFQNIERVQKGTKSRAFSGARPSPVQERAITGFHRSLRRFLKDPHSDDRKI